MEEARFAVCGARDEGLQVGFVAGRVAQTYTAAGGRFCLVLGCVEVFFWGCGDSDVLLLL